MRKSSDAPGALATAIGPGAAATLTGKMPVGDAVPRETWPGAVRRRQTSLDRSQKNIAHVSGDGPAPSFGKSFGS